MFLILKIEHLIVYILLIVMASFKYKMSDINHIRNKLNTVIIFIRPSDGQGQTADEGTEDGKQTGGRETGKNNMQVHLRVDQVFGFQLPTWNVCPC